MKVIGHKIKFKCYFPEEAFSELQKKIYSPEISLMSFCRGSGGFFSFPLKMLTQFLLKYLCDYLASSIVIIGLPSPVRSPLNPKHSVCAV